MRCFETGIVSTLLLLGMGCATAPAPRVATARAMPEAEPVVIAADARPGPVLVASAPVDITPVESEPQVDLATIEVPPPPAEGTIVVPERVELEEEAPPVVRQPPPARPRRRRVRQTTMHDPVFSAPTVFAPSSGDETFAPPAVP